MQYLGPVTGDDGTTWHRYTDVEHPLKLRARRARSAASPGVARHLDIPSRSTRTAPASPEAARVARVFNPWRPK